MNERNAKNAMRFAPMFATKPTATEAPLAAASITFFSFLEKKSHVESQLYHHKKQSSKGLGLVGH